MNRAIEQMVIQSGRSWWQAHYRDDRVISEWDTVQAPSKVVVPTLGELVGVVQSRQVSPAIAKTTRWEEVEKKGMNGIRLLCPNGQVAEIRSSTDYRFLQLKRGYWAIGQGSFCQYHIIGAVNDDGTTECYAWDTVKRKVIKFKDNVHNFAFDHIGPLSLEVQGLKL